MTNFVFDLINQFSYMAISFLIAIENVFPPIPSEVILSFAGFATHHSQMTVVGTVIASTIGAVLGALILYGIGWFLNEERLERILDHKAFKMLGLKEAMYKRQSIGLISTAQALFSIGAASLSYEA
ncbi:hypothetical protein IMAU10031_00227 [Lactobacillus helveticus]|nr:hypothetical protein [Lactobacillus helveticus]NRO38080.1 hypothetical protein [Lactobacillus helveticus]NRO75380.1 hypothetical protein [Lactobacillus helveticus]